MFDELEQLQQKNRSDLNMVRVKSNAIQKRLNFEDSNELIVGSAAKSSSQLFRKVDENHYALFDVSKASRDNMTLL